MVRTTIYLFIFSVLFYPFVIGGESWNKKTIEILLSSDSSIYEEGVAGLRSVIKAKTRTILLDVLVAEQENLSSYFNHVENSNMPLYIAMGPKAVNLARKYITKIPLLFTMVNSPKVLNLQKSNLCGVSMDISISDFFQTAKDINPDIRRIYSFYSTSQGEFLSGEGDYNDLQNKLLFTKVKLKTGQSLENALDNLEGQADAIYMPADPLYNQENFNLLSDFCRKNKVILMTSFRSLVKAGATFGLSPDYTKLGILTGEMANRILAGLSKCKDELIILPEEASFILNEGYAQKSNINLPESIIRRAKLTKLFRIGVVLLNELKLKSARIVFEGILKRDPGNKAADKYLDVIIEKQTGALTSKYLNLAQEYIAKKKYGKARENYIKILKLNPKSAIAKDGYRVSTYSYSEAVRKDANYLAGKGNRLLR